MKKRGLSGVVSVVIIIAVVMAAGVLVWNFVENMISDRIESTEVCSEATQNVVINNDYTCYEMINKSIRLSIGVKDIELDGLLIAINSKEFSKTRTISKDAKTFQDIKNYPSRSGSVAIPGKNSGDTYLVTGLEGMSRDTIRISISPIINGEQCGTSDTMNNVYSCSAFD